jgi:hypothetical protein
MVQEMTKAEKYDRMITGIICGFVLPIIIGLLIFLFTTHDKSIPQYLKIIINGRIITHAITICVFPNIFIFLLFSRFDMLRASRGVLAITIAWACAVFIVKFV